MIPINELRQGNYYRCKVYNGNNDVILPFTWQEYMYAHLFEPIPLTPEVLEACGFEDWGKKEVNELETEWTFAQYNIIEGTSSLLVCLIESKYDGGVYKEWVLRIDHDTVYTKELAYLHQLQNLYHSLTGQELTPDL